MEILRNHEIRNQETPIIHHDVFTCLCLSSISIISDSKIRVYSFDLCSNKKNAWFPYGYVRKNA